MLEAGTVAVNHNSALGSGTITLAGGKLQAGGGARTLSNALVATASTTSEVISPSGNNLTLNGNLSGTGTIWKTGGNSVYLGGDNSAFAGTFSHRQSNMYFNAATAGSAAATWDITGGNQFGANFATAGTLQFGSLAGTSGAIHGGGGSGSKVWEIGALNTSTSYTGTIAGSTVSLVKKGTGTLTLSGNNTFTGGATIDAGTLRLTNVAGAGTGTIGIGNGTLSLYRSGATTTYANAITSLSGTTGTLTVDGSGSNAGTGTNSTYATGTITVDGTLTVSRPAGGNGTTIFAGLLAGNGVLKAANTNGGVAPSTSAFGRGWFNNTGNTFAGEVNVLSGGNFLNSSLAPSYTLVDIATGGYLTLRGSITTTIGSLTGGGTITKSITSDISTLVVGSGNASSTFSGVIGQTALNATGTVALKKTGTGTVTLSGSNTFTGGSTLDAGMLAAANNSALGTGAITLSGGKLQSANAARTLSNALVATAATTSEVVSPSFNLTLNGNLTGSGTIHKTGANKVLLGGNNSGFTGTFSNRASNVYFTNANAGSAAAIWDLSGGAFLGTNFTGTATVYLGALTGTTGKLSVTTASTGTKTYEVGGRNEDFSYGATIADATSGGGKAILKKVGTGTMELLGTITATGAAEVASGALLFAENASTNGSVIESGTGVLICVSEFIVVTIGTLERGDTAATVSPSYATAINGITFTFSAKAWIKDWVTLLTNKIKATDFLNNDPETPFGSSNYKYKSGTVGTEKAVKWEDYLDNDYNDWYNYLTEKQEYRYKTLLPGECPCACALAEQKDENGSASVTSPYGNYSSLYAGSPQNIKTPYTIPSLSQLTGLASIKATLTLGSSVSQDYYYDPSSVAAGDQVFLNLLVDASAETSGDKAWTINLEYLSGSGTSLLSDSVEGRYTLINRTESVFGNGWMRNDIDQLTFSADYAAVIYGNGADDVVFYDNSRLFYSFSADSEERQLVRDGSNYRLSDKYGNATLFDSAGRLLSRATATGLTTTYAYVSGQPDLLETVTTPDGDVTRFSYETYASGTKWRVATMVEHDQSLNNVTTDFTYNSTSDNLLTQTVRTTNDIVPVIKTETFAYDPTTKLLTDITDSESNTTTISYDYAGRVSVIE